jgi:membrane dipeptidase
LKQAIFIQACEFTVGDDFPFDEAYVEELTNGEVTALNETIASTNANFDEIFRRTYQLHRKCETLGVVVPTTASDIERARGERKLAMIFGLQHLPFSTTVYPDDLGFMDMLYEQGVRIAQLTYQRRSLLADGCGERTDSGLSKFGIQVLEEMNRLGMIIDLSHVGTKSTTEAIEISKDPVVFTHANCRSICNHVRNKSDEQIKALAEKDGVIGICAFTPILNLQRRGTMSDFLDHMSHAIDLVGVDHVGIGLDAANPSPVWKHPDIDVQRRAWRARLARIEANTPEIATSLYPWGSFVPGKGSPYLMEEFEVASRWKTNIIKGMISRGYSPSEIEKVLGGNFMRVFKRVWKA